MGKPGPKETERTRKAVELYLSGRSLTTAAYLAKVNPSTLHRALARRKEKR